MTKVEPHEALKFVLRQKSHRFDRPRDHIRVVQVDGKQNSKVQSVFFEDLPILSASFSADGSEVCPFLYTLNTFMYTL